jgi:RNA polymerase sigma-70 factor (ECF subfamily)
MTEPARRMSDEPDPAIRLALLRANDPDTIHEAIRELVPSVRRWLYRLLGRTPDLDDATQDALAEIATFLPRFEGRSSLETVAHRITVRVAYRYFGRAREVPLEVVPDVVGGDSGAESRVMAREALVRLHRCLARLPAKRRVAFVLCAIEGMTPTEAARVADTTALAMRCRLSRARREIARMLARDPYVGAWIEVAS